VSLEKNDERIAKLIRATHAPADPAVLARARARIAAMGESSEPAWVRWLARPAVLAASGGLLAVTLAAGGWMLRSAAVGLVETSGTIETVAISDLLGDDGSYGLAFDESGSSESTVGDSGSVR